MNNSLNYSIIVLAALTFAFGCNKPDSSNPPKPKSPQDSYEIYSTAALTEKIETQFLDLVPYCQTTLRIDEDRSGSTVKSYKATAVCKLTKNEDIFSFYNSLKNIETMTSRLRARTDISHTQLKSTSAISIALAPYFSELTAFVATYREAVSSLELLVNKLGCKEISAGIEGSFFRCLEFTDSPTTKLERFPYLYSQYAAKAPHSLPELSFYRNNNMEKDFLTPIELSKKNLVLAVLKALNLDVSYYYLRSDEIYLIKISIPDPMRNPMIQYPKTVAEEEVKEFFSQLRSFKSISPGVLASVVKMLKQRDFAKTLSSIEINLGKQKNDIHIDRDKNKRRITNISVDLSSNPGAPFENIEQEIQNTISLVDELHSLANRIAPQISFRTYGAWSSNDLKFASKEILNLRELAMVNDRLAELIEKHQIDLDLLFDYELRNSGDFDFLKYGQSPDKGNRTVIEIKSMKSPLSGENLVNSLSEFLSKQP